MAKTWVVVADSSRARIFATDSNTAPLVEIETLTHPESRAHEQRLTSDLPGRGQGTGSAQSRHGMDSETSPKKHEANSFAKEIASHLERGINDHRYDQLIITSAPALLGSLRSQLSNAVSKTVIFELDKNLTQQTPEVIRSHLPDFLR